jgi:hypothetical protein
MDGGIRLLAHERNALLKDCRGGTDCERRLRAHGADFEIVGFRGEPSWGIGKSANGCKERLNGLLFRERFTAERGIPTAGSRGG